MRRHGQTVSRQLPGSFRGPADGGRLAGGRHLELPVHRSLAAQRLSPGVLACRRWRRRSAALLRVGKVVGRRRCAAERQREQEIRSWKLLVRAARQPVVQLEHVVHQGQHLEHGRRQQCARAHAQRVPPRPQLRVGRSSRNREQVVEAVHHERDRSPDDGRHHAVEPDRESHQQVHDRLRSGADRQSQSASIRFHSGAERDHLGSQEFVPDADV